MLCLLAAGCSLPRHEIPLNRVIEHKLGDAHNGIPGYRCTIGAHRGASVAHRENTLKALLAAEADPRYAFIEFDVQYSRDQRIVVFHDRRLLRLFGIPRSIGNLTYADLVEFTGGEVCAYEDVMPLLRKKLNIEIKSQGDDAEDARLADELIADLRRRKRLKHVMISSISAEVIRHLNRHHPDVPTGKIHWLTSSTYVHFDAFTRGLYENLDAMQADYLMLHTDNLRNIEALLALKPKNKTVVFWDFDDTMYLVHKDGGDRLWGESGFKNVLRQSRYNLNTPPVPSPAHHLHHQHRGPGG